MLEIAKKPERALVSRDVMLFKVGEFLGQGNGSMFCIAQRVQYKYLVTGLYQGRGNIEQSQGVGARGRGVEVL